jgi:hypothetical protein
MQFISHTVGGISVAELDTHDQVIRTVQDGVDLLGNLYYQGFDRVVIREENLAEGFFDLKNGIAGEILQKFSNYRILLAIVGDFRKFEKKSVRDFIYESNQTGQINFASTVEEAIQRLAQ